MYQHPSTNVDAFATSKACCNLDLWPLKSNHLISTNCLQWGYRKNRHSQECRKPRQEKSGMQRQVDMEKLTPHEPSNERPNVAQREPENIMSLPILSGDESIKVINQHHIMIAQTFKCSRSNSQLIIPSRAQESLQVYTAEPWYLSGNSNDRSINGSHICDV